MNVSTRTSTPTKDKSFQAKTIIENSKTNNLFARTGQIRRWMTCLLIALGLWITNSFAQIPVTVSGTAVTSPALNPTYLNLSDALSAVNAITSYSTPGTIVLTCTGGNNETAPAKGFFIGSATLNPLLSSTNTITIVASGGAVTVNAGVGTVTPTNATPDGIFSIRGADYVTIDGLTFTDGNATNPATMEFGIALFKLGATDGAQNNTIQNCTINVKNVNNASGTTPMIEGAVGILMINSTAAAATTALTITTAAGTNSNNKFYTNTINGGNYGMGLIGFAGSTPFTTCDTNNDVGGAALSTGNSILNFGGGATSSPSAAIRTLAQYGLNVSYNTVNNNTGSNVNHGTTLRGIYLNTATSANVTISNNTVSLQSGATTSACTAIDNQSGSTSASNTININNNTVNVGYPTATSGVYVAINNSATATTVNINNNTIAQIPSVALAGTGTHVMIETGSPVSANANNNTISNITRNGASGSWRGIKTTSPTNFTANGNTIENLSWSLVTSTGSFDGIYSLSSAVNVTANNNIIRNLSTPSTGSLRGIVEFGISGLKTFQNNQIYNFSTTAGGAGGASFTGISESTGSTNDISNNRIYSLNSTGTTGGTSGTIVGITVSSGTTNNIYKNKVYDLSTTSTGGNVNGITVSGGTTANVYNNLVGDLRASALNAANSLGGINISGGTTSNVYYNTVYLNATSSGALFGSAALNASTSPNLTLRNNIFVNLSTPVGATGFTVAYRRSGTTLTSYNSNSNRNLFYAGAPGANNLIYYDGTTPYSGLVAYQGLVTPRDANSVTETVSPTAGVYFQSLTGADAGFLHIVNALSTQLESGGSAIAGITDDYDADTRNVTTPDIGADEFNGVSPTPVVVLNSLTPGTTALCTATARLVSVTATTPAGTITGVTITYNNGVLNSNIPMTNTSGDIWEYTIPAASPVNATVTWSVTATNSVPLSVTLPGSSYSDEPLFGTVATATATPSTVCAGAPSILTASISNSAAALPSGYCASAATGTTEDDIGQVTFAGINNPAVRPTPQQSNTGAIATYTDFTAVTPATVTAGSSYPITVYHIHSGTDVTANFSNVYIDFNRNGSFDDGGESFSLTKVGGAFLTDFTGSIAIPANALPGRTRMRVIVKEGAITASCGSQGSWAEVEDYLVDISTLGTSTVWNDASTLNPRTVNPTSTTNYSATITFAGCTINTNTVSVTTIALPASPNASNSTQCGSGVPTAAVGTGGQNGVFRWYNQEFGGTLLQTGGATYAGSISSTTTFWVSEDDGSGGCESLRTAVLASVNAPDVVVASSNGPVCANSPLTLTATVTTNTNSNNYTYVWAATPSVGSGIPTTVSGGTGTFGSPANTSVTPTAGGSYDYTVSATDGACFTTSTITVVVKAQPVVDSIKATPSTICLGSTTSLSVYSTGIGTGPQTLPGSYPGSQANDPDDEDILNVTFGSLNNTSTCLTTGGPGSILNQYSNFTTTVSAPTVTVGDVVSYSVAGGTCGGNFSNKIGMYIDYNRDGTFTVDETVFAEASATSGPHTVSGTTTIPLTAKGGLTLMRVVQIETTGAIGPIGAYSWGETEDYVVNIIGNVPQSPSLTYTWDNGAGTGSTVTANPPTTPSTTYNVTVYDGVSTCSQNASVVVTVNPVPTAPSATPSDQCGSGVPTASVATTSGTPVPVFNWYDASVGGNLLQSGISSTFAGSVNSDTTFWVSETANGCEGPRVAVSITVNIPDQLTVTSSTGTDACAGETFTITSSYTPVNQAFDLYTLTASPEAGSGITNPVTLTINGTTDGTDPYSISPTVPGTYIYTVTATEGGLCASIKTVTVTMHALPVLDSVTTSPNPAVVCNGTPVTLNAYAAGLGSGPQTPPTGYGVSIPNSVDDEEILNVTFGSLNNTSTCATTGGGSSVLNRYSDYTGSVAAPTVSAGQVVPFSIEGGTCGGDWDNRIAVFIDYNRDGVFGPGETAYIDAALVEGPHTVSGNITIPSNAIAGVTLMRVIVSEATGSNPTGNISPINISDPTYQYAWGETEDYLINIIGVVPQDQSLIYTWDNGAGTGSTVSVSPSSTTTYTVSVTDAYGCAAISTGSATVTVNPVPTAPTATNSTQCGVGVPTASVTSTSGFATPIFKWYDAASGGNLLQTGISNTYTTAIGTVGVNNFYVSEISAAGCESATRTLVTVTVTAPPALGITPAGATTFCDGGSVSLTAAGSGYVNFAWSPTTGLTPTTGATVVAAPTTTTTYTVTADDGVPVTGCSNTATITITVNPNPVISNAIATPAIICGGNSTLSAAVLDNITFNIGEATEATPGSFGAFNDYGMYFSSTYASTINTVDVYPSTAGTLIVQLRNASNTVVDTKNFTILAGDISTSVPKTLTLNFSVPAGSTGWSIYYPLASVALNRGGGTYSYPYVNGSFAITGNTLDGNNIIGGSRYYFYNWNVTASADNSGAYVWEWTPGPLAGSTVVVTPAGTTTYSVKATNPGTTCFSTFTPVTVTVTPVATAASASASPVCAGATVTLNANATGSPTTFTWSDGGPTVYPNTASITVNPTTTTTYTVTALDACSNSGVSSVTVTVNPLPTAGIAETGPISVCDPATQVLTATTDAGSATYQWRLNGVDIPSATSNTYTVSGLGAGAYSVVVTNSLTGCISLPSASVTVSVNPVPTGVTATATPGTICAGETINLTASAATPPSTILTQGWEAGLGSWTAVNLTTGGTTPATSAWTINTNPFTSTNSTPVTFNSGGGTSFILSNVDLGGSGTAVNSRLTSPSFSTMGYSSLALSLNHYYRFSFTVEAFVEVSTDGTNWTTVKSYGSTQGTSTAFVTDNIDLSAYVNNASVQVRFRYQNGWSWYWAIDDIAVTGTPAAFNYSWTSTPSGFTSALQNPTNVAPLANTTYNVSVSYASTGCATPASTSLVTVTECPSTLSLTAFLEGFYSDINTMRATIYDLGISTDPTETDTLMVNLWSPLNLSSPTPDYSELAVVHTDGTVDPITFPAGLGGDSYYIAVKHRNHLETWSKLPVAFKPAVSYNFTTAQSQAYDDGFNNPMASVAGGKFAFYGGDVNQDGQIEASDLADVDNDNSGFAYGYNDTDATGDGPTDASDLQIVDNNSQLFLFYARPY